MKLLARLCDDIDASPSVRQFLQADPSRLPIWLKFNKVEAPANKSISEWLERFWYDAHASFSLDAPAAGPLSVRYQNQYIAKINPDGSLDIGPSVHNFVLPVDGADIRHISPDGSSAILRRDGQARILQCACFPAGTLVHTPGGTVAIESLKPDDLIMAYDTQTRDTVISQVRQVAKKTWYSLVRVVTPSDTIWATPNHPFYIPALGRYLPADSLRRGVQLLALTGALLTVQSVAAVDTTVSVYNFEVADHHNYYVGSEGVLVHNDCVFVKAGLKSADGVPPADDFDIVNQAFLSDLGEVQTALARFEIRELLTGANGEALTAFFRGDDLAATLSVVERRAAQVGRVKAWERLHTLLPDNLKHFARDLEHLSFLQNTDVQSALSWISSERPHLFDAYPNLTPGELASLSYYTTDNGYQINFLLRGLPVKEGIDWTAEHANRYLVFLDRAFDKLDGYSQSNVLLRLEGRMHQELFDAWNNSIPLEYPSYISTAKNNNSSFIDGGNSPNVLFEINPNHNAKMVDMQPFSMAENTDIGSELEVLISKGKRKQITNIEYKDFPAPNDIQLYYWVTNTGPSGFGINGISIPTNPNAIDPSVYYLEDFLNNNMSNITSGQLEAAKKILTVSVEIID